MSEKPEKTFTVYDGGNADEKAIETVMLNLNRTFRHFKIIVERGLDLDRLTIRVSRFNEGKIGRIDMVKKVTRYWMSGFVYGCRKGGK